ncbi:RimJ/RimL family protein N-acetyltransferase [Planomicrobium soli]|uniref:RimJ/RimL family protein N-acetyltransferase n=1 Tax=Planomicrobium soli TaxID=1176648 RepID=A0A2P8H418_9BACL|nr:GNAT family N-acetyltransferase [Planomicrobium soli]PSL40961.1 RimJ/RimL family protein N-acetyltransferase [Planomicrobium soli]
MQKKYDFESERLGFRRWQEEDKEPFAAMNADADVMRFFPNPLTKKESDLLIERLEKHFKEKGYGIWAVERKEGQVFIGFIGLLEIGFEVDFKFKTEIGWRLDRKHWKKGYAVEGAMACLNYAFDEMQLDEVYSFTSVLNVPSETVMQRTGMRKVKEFDHPKLEADSPLKRHVLYKINRP